MIGKGICQQDAQAGIANLKNIQANQVKHGGSRKGAGRKKGVPSQITTDVKGMILAALDKAGGPQYLLDQSERNPVAFMTLVGKVLPLTVSGDPDQPLTISITRKIVSDKSGG